MANIYRANTGNKTRLKKKRQPRHWYGTNIMACLYTPPLVHQKGKGIYNPQKTCMRHWKIKPAFASLDLGFAPGLGLS